jgi:hypothetical protein
MLPCRKALGAQQYGCYGDFDDELFQKPLDMDLTLKDERLERLMQI